MTTPSQSLQIAQTILDGFDHHFELFSQLTAKARAHFESADWKGNNTARVERIAYYDTRVRESVTGLQQQFGLEDHDEALWKRVKLQYMGLLYEHKQPELAESFYNSVFCQLFDRRYYKNSHIFVRPGLSTDVIDMEAPAYRSYYPEDTGLRDTLEALLKSFNFTLLWENFERNLSRLLRSLQTHLELLQPG